MKLKKTFLSVVACAVALVMTVALAACGKKDPVMKSIALSETAIEIDTGESKVLSVNATYSDGTTDKLSSSKIDEFTSSDEAVATVTKSGSVMGRGKGTATITAKVGEFNATCTVTVHSLVVKVTGEGVTEGAAELEINQTLQLAASVEKDDVPVTDAEVVWTSDKPTAATVDAATGLVTAMNPGEATITATYNETQSASVKVNVLTIAGAANMTNKEQNKAEANAWGFWNDKGYNWSNTTIDEDGGVYTEPYREPEEDGYIGAGKVNITFSVDSYTTGANAAAIQLFYRSAGADGKLLTNHNYEVTLKILSTASGKVSINDYRKLPDQYPPEDAVLGEITEDKTDEDYLFDVEANTERTITVQFRHGDSGAIYAEGHWDNVESALQICLGLLSEPIDGSDKGSIVKVSVYDIHFKDLGEAQKKWEDNPANLVGYEAPEIPVELPTLDATAIDLATPAEKEGYVFTSADEGKSLNVVYTDVQGGSYDSVYFDIPESANANENNIFEVTVTNNGEESIAIRFDVETETAHNSNDNKDIVKSSAATLGTPGTDTTYGGTVITVRAGRTVTLQLTYDVSLGAPKQIRVLFNTHIYQDQGTENTYSGDVTIGGFKFGYIEPLPEYKNNLEVTGVTLKASEDQSKAIYVISGTYDNTVDAEKLEVYLENVHFDLQQCGGAWKNNESFAREVKVNNDGTWSVEFDITSLAVDTAGTGAYTSHFIEKDPSEEGYSDNKYRDVKLSAEAAVPGETITVGTKTFTIVNYNGSDEFVSNEANNWGQAFNYGCVAIKVENVTAAE